MRSSSDIVLATINAKWIHPSLALRLLRANLGNLEENCQILEFALRQPLIEKVEPILKARPRLLGLSVSIWNHSATLELLKALEEKWAKNRNGEPAKWQKPVVVLGGPEVSWLPEEAEIFRHADYVIRGEGEESFRSLCYDLFRQPPDQQGVKGGAVFINRGDTTVNVCGIIPAYSLYTDEDLRKKHVYVEASRGCPFGCDFCLNAAKDEGPGHEGLQKTRNFPLEPFLDAMGNLIDRGARLFKFLDRTFNLETERATRIMEYFLERIESSGKKEEPLCVHFEMVPSLFPPALKETIRRFPPGSLRLEVGIQTFNQKTAALINRPYNSGEILENLKFLRRETNAIIHADLIAGLPAEDLASFGLGFDLLWTAISGERPAGMRGLGFEIQPGILKCLPGTPIIRHNNAYGMVYSARAPYEVIETSALSSAELGRIKNFARFWEIIVNRNPFPDLLPGLLPAGEPAFKKFMILSDDLLVHFGKNWGIDRKELKHFIEDRET